MRLATAASLLLLALAAAASADETAGAGAVVNLPAGATAASASADAPARTAEQLANLRRAILTGLVDKKPAVRAAAEERLVAAWPDTAGVLDEALSHESVDVRVAAVQLLGRAELGDTSERVRRKFTDSSPAVRTQAVRVARHRRTPKVESEFVRLVEGDPAWVVRQEALRGLEDFGTVQCLRKVLAGWCDEKDEDRRSRYHRVLVRIVGKDCGADAEAWRAAVDAAIAADKDPKPK